ncbi:hypothetical protein CTA1_11783 [Colletotrichum tanaceti]|uniref:NAD-specific glutamate dehydrogenase n=1 Tax=Colletotrichum tanaceti TaxID=1306861 RepID=A0A4U6XAE0_9PEZI|nr:hypothetical protein CTA1_11783 [Colletotrichum tanaceti]
MARHQLGRLRHGRVLAHRSHGDDRLAVGVVRDKGRLLHAALQHNVVPPADRVAAVPELRPQGRPEDGDEVRRLDGRADNVVCDGATRVLRNVPVLDACVLAVAPRPVVGVRGDVANGVHVLQSHHLKALVRLDRSVVLEADDLVLPQKLRGGRNADAEDDEVGFELGAILEVDGADVGRVRSRRLGLIDAGVHVELDAILLEALLDAGADLLAQHSLEGNLFHADDGDRVVLGRGVGDLHANKGRPDNDNLLALVADGGNNLFGVVSSPQGEDVAQDLEALEGQVPRGAAGGEDQLGVGNLVALLGGDVAVREVDVGDLISDPVDGAALVKVLVAPLQGVDVGQQGLGQLGAVDGEVAFRGDNGQGAVVATVAKTLDGAQSAGASADDDDLVLLGAAGGIALEVGLAAAGLDGGLVARDVDCAVALGDLESGESVEGGGILDVAGFGVEAGWTRQSARGGEDTFDEGSAVVGALGTDSLDGAAGVDKQDLCTLDALDLNLLLVAWLERQRGDGLELVVGHGS